MNWRSFWSSCREKGLFCEVLAWRLGGIGCLTSSLWCPAHGLRPAVLVLEVIITTKCVPLPRPHVALYSEQKSVLDVDDTQCTWPTVNLTLHGTYTHHNWCLSAEYPTCIFFWNETGLQWFDVPGRKQMAKTFAGWLVIVVHICLSMTALLDQCSMWVLV